MMSQVTSEVEKQGKPFNFRNPKSTQSHKCNNCQRVIPKGKRHISSTHRVKIFGVWIADTVRHCEACFFKTGERLEQK